MSFRTQGRVDVEPPSVADSLRECAAASPRVYQAAVDAAVDNVESEVVEIFSSSCLNSLANSPVLFSVQGFDVFIQKTCTDF
jgi:hypothetical protein